MGRREWLLSLLFFYFLLTIFTTLGVVIGSHLGWAKVPATFVSSIRWTLLSCIAQVGPFHQVAGQDSRDLVSGWQLWEPWPPLQTVLRPLHLSPPRPPQAPSASW